MAPESVGTKNISLKDSLNKALVEKTPLIGVFVKCIDTHSELSLDQRRQWLTFTTYQYDSIKPRSIKKLKNYHDVSEILHIPETEVIQHIKSVLGDPNCESLWEKLQKEIDAETKKNPKLYNSSRLKEAPIPQETINKVIWQRTKTNRTNPVIALIVGLPESRLHHLIRKLVNKKKIPARGHTKSRPTVRS